MRTKPRAISANIEGNWWDFVSGHLSIVKAGKIERAWPFRNAGRFISESPGMPKLEPELDVVFAALFGKLTEALKVGRIVQRHVARLLSVSIATLYFAYNR